MDAVYLHLFHTINSNNLKQKNDCIKIIYAFIQTSSYKFSMLFYFVQCLHVRKTHIHGSYISDTPISEVSITASLDVSTLIKAENKNEIS